MFSENCPGTLGEQVLEALDDGAELHGNSFGLVADGTPYHYQVVVNRSRYTG